jgi:methyltransferase (TIGR00027 family)
MDLLGATSRWVAAGRARESERPDRLFEDPLARALAGEEGFRLLDEMAKAAGSGGDNGYVAIRTRFFDELLLQATAHIHQIVIVAAGMDARAFRLDWPAGTTLFEIEREQVFNVKEPILREVGATPRCDRRLVGVDLAEDWERSLLSRGFSTAVPAAFLVEGLTTYLWPDQVENLLQRITGVAARGSRLGVDIIGTSFLESPWTKPYLTRLEAEGIGWHFGTDEPEQFLSSFGWDAKATLPGEPEANWGRWPYPVAPASVPGFPKCYLVRATRR